MSSAAASPVQLPRSNTGPFTVRGGLTPRSASVLNFATAVDDENSKKLAELSRLVDELQTTLARARGLSPNPAPVPQNASLEDLKAYVGQVLNDFNTTNTQGIDLLVSAVANLDTEARREIVSKLNTTQNVLVTSLTAELDKLKNQINDKERRDEINRQYTATLQTATSDLGLARTQLAVLKQRTDYLAGERQRQFDGIISQIQNLKSEIEAERASLLPVLTETRADIQALTKAVIDLTPKLATPPSNDQQTEAMTQALANIDKLVKEIPASIRDIRITAPAVSVTAPQATVSTPEVTTAINDLIAVIRAGGVSGIGNSVPATQTVAQTVQGTPPTPSDFELKRDTAVAALQQVIEQYKSYVRNAGDAVPYLKRPYRAEVYYDVSEKRHKTRGVPALVPSREFSNLLATGCGALGQAITALANARSARARTHVQHPQAALGVLRMNTVVVGHPAGPAARGVVPLDAPGHLAMALHDDVAAAEYAVQQAFHELEGKLSPYEVFRVFPPGDDRRDAVMPTDVDDMFRHAASLEATRALDRILARVHVRSASCWPQQGINPFDTLEALQKHVYALVVPRTQPSVATLDKERLAGVALERQIAAHEARQREARIYREARDAAREVKRKADLETAQIARQARLVARV